MNELILAFLKSNDTVTASPCYDRIFLDAWLPDGYKKSSGAAIVFRPRGGAGVDNFIAKSQIYEFRSFSQSKDEAFEVSAAIFTAMSLATYPNSGQQFYPRVVSDDDLTRSEGGWYVVTQQFSLSMVVC